MEKRRLKKWNGLLLCAALMVVAPAIVTLPGCGGGSTLSTVQNFNNLRVDLGNGQVVTLNLAVRSGGITGTMVVPAAVTARSAIGTRDLGFTIPPGTYEFTGVFTAPRGFTVTGSYQSTGGATVPFTITGQVPTTSEAGTFTFTALGQSVSGTIPPLTAPTPTATPAA